MLNPVAERFVKKAAKSLGLPESPPPSEKKPQKKIKPSQLYEFQPSRNVAGYVNVMHRRIMPVQEVPVETAIESLQERKQHLEHAKQQILQSPSETVSINGEQISKKAAVTIIQHQEKEIDKAIHQLEPYRGKTIQAKQGKLIVKVQRPTPQYESETKAITSKGGGRLAAAIIWSAATKPYRIVKSFFTHKKEPAIVPAPKILQKPLQKESILLYEFHSDVASFGAGVIQLPNIASGKIVGHELYKPPKFARRHYVTPWDYAFEPVGWSPKGSSKAMSGLIKAAPVASITGFALGEMATGIAIWGTSKLASEGIFRLSKAIRLKKAIEIEKIASQRSILSKRITPSYEAFMKKEIKAEVKGITRRRYPKAILRKSKRGIDVIKFEGVPEGRLQITGIRAKVYNIIYWKGGKKVLAHESLRQPAQKVTYVGIRKGEVAGIARYKAIARKFKPPLFKGKGLQFQELTVAAKKADFAPIRTVVVARKGFSGITGILRKRAYTFEQAFFEHKAVQAIRVQHLSGGFVKQLLKSVSKEALTEKLPEFAFPYTSRAATFAFAMEGARAFQYRDYQAGQIIFGLPSKMDILVPKQKIEVTIRERKKPSSVTEKPITFPSRTPAPATPDILYTPQKPIQKTGMPVISKKSIFYVKYAKSIESKSRHIFPSSKSQKPAKIIFGIGGIKVIQKTITPEIQKITVSKIMEAHQKVMPKTKKKHGRRPKSPQHIFYYEEKVATTPKIAPLPKIMAGSPELIPAGGRISPANIRQPKAARPMTYLQQFVFGAEEGQAGTIKGIERAGEIKTPIFYRTPVQSIKPLGISITEAATEQNERGKVTPTTTFPSPSPFRPIRIFFEPNKKRKKKVAKPITIDIGDIYRFREFKVGDILQALFGGGK